MFSFNHPALLVLAIAAGALAVAPPAFAQGAGAGSGGGLFGGTRSEVSGRNRLDVTFDLSEALESELPTELRVGLPQNSRHAGGLSSMFMGAAAYAHNRRRFQVAGNLETAFKYYNRLNLVDPVGHSAGLGASIRLPGTATFKVDQSAAYSPSFLFGLFPSATAPALGDAIPVAPEYGVLEAESYRYKSEATFSVGSARGTRATMSGGFDRTEFRNMPGTRPRLESYNGRATLSRGLRRNLGMSLEYQYRTGEFGFVQQGGTSEEQRVAIGADYTRPFSGGRRLNLRGNIAPSWTDIPADASRELPAGQLYRMQGDATVGYSFRRTWQVSGTARRSAEYIAVLGEPVFSDGGGLTLQGQLTRRLDLSANAAYTSGASALNAESRLESYTGTVRTRFALNRSLAIYGEYLYYYYDMRQYQRQVVELPSLFDQHGVRVGIMVWASAF